VREDGIDGSTLPRTLRRIIPNIDNTMSTLFMAHLPCRNW
jgi:hypothetical protein